MEVPIGRWILPVLTAFLLMGTVLMYEALKSCRQDSLRRGAGGIAAVCDRDSVIAVAGGGKKELLDKPVSPELEQIMVGRGVYRSVGGGEVPVSVEDGSFCVSVAAPVLSEGDVLGCVLFVAPRGSAAGTELELKLAQTAAIFLGKQFDTNL